MAVVDLDAKREQREVPGWNGLTCRECGGAWFSAKVALEDGLVTAFAHPLVCCGCGLRAEVV